MIWLHACVPPQPVVEARRVDLVLVPGCPTLPDGRLSECQWQRVAWAQHLWAVGVVERFVTSGDAVHNRFVEADAMAAGLVALGVPAERILREPRALHTDQNVALSLELLAPGWSFGVASDPLQAPGCCAMAEAWGRDCVALVMDVPLTRARVEAGLPELRAEPVPPERWLPLDERERRIAALTGRRRGNSLLLYMGKALLRPFGLSRPPPAPPPIEALLR